MENKQKSIWDNAAFTLIEVLVVIGILVVLSLVVVYTLNPHQLITQGQDGNRVAAVGTLDKAISLYYSDAISNPNTLYMGTSSVVYVSVPDPTATTTAGTNCAGIGLTSTSTVYHCASPSTYMKTDGTGWVPINFSSYSGGNILATLPVDPINTIGSGQYYMYTTNGTQYEVEAFAATTKNASSSDFQKGTNIALLPTSPTGSISGGGGTGGTGGNITYTTSTYALTGIPIGVNIMIFDSHTNSIWVLSTSTVTQINDTTHATSSFAVATNYDSFIAFDPHTNSIWITNPGNDTIEVINDTTGATSTIATGAGAAPGGIAFDSNDNSMWVANNDITLMQINDTTFATSSFAGLGGYNALTIDAFAPNTNSIFLMYSFGGNITMFNDTTHATSSINGLFPFNSVVFDSHNNLFWGVSDNTNTIYSVNDVIPSAVTYPLGMSGRGIAFDSHTNSLWVGNRTSTTVMQVDDTTHATTSFAIAAIPNSLVFDPHNNTIWVTNSTNSNIVEFVPSQ